jgi:hypothetical protein
MQNVRTRSKHHVHTHSVKDGSTTDRWSLTKLPYDWDLSRLGETSAELTLRRECAFQLHLSFILSTVRE